MNNLGSDPRMFRKLHASLDVTAELSSYQGINTWSDNNNTTLNNNTWNRSDGNNTQAPEMSGPPFFVIDHVIVPLVWGLIVIIGFLGNGLVVYVMLRYGELKATNRYITSLALTDLAFIVFVIVPTILHYATDSWIFGEAICKFHMYMSYVTVQATCLTMSAMTIDRYLAIVRPIESMNIRTPGVALAVSIIIWIVSLVLGTPFGIYHGIKGSPNYDGPAGPIYCRETWSLAWGQAALTVLVIVTYVIPFGIFVFCYTSIIRHLWLKGHGVGFAPSESGSRVPANGTRGSIPNNTPPRRRRKTTKMVAVVVVLFATSWLPIHVFQLWFKYDPDFPMTDMMFYFKIIAHTMSYANPVINPFVYSFLCEGFRKAARKAFSHCRLARRLLFGQPSRAATSSASRDHEGASTAVSSIPLHQSDCDISDTDRPIRPRSKSGYRASDAIWRREVMPIVPRSPCISSTDRRAVLDVG